MGKENRRAPREHHDSVMELFDEDGRFITGIGRLVNVSTVGVCFSSTHKLEKGEHIRARLRLLKTGPLEVEGHVVWVRKRPNSILYGVAFDSNSPSKR